MFPFVLGECNDEAPLEDAAKTVSKRFRANAWGLGALQLDLDRSAQERERTEAGLLKRVLQRFERKEVTIPFDFESDLYLWGRPFFITHQNPSAVSASIDRYMDAPIEEIDTIVQEMLAQRWPSFAGQIQPDLKNGTPSDDECSREARWKIQLFREACEAIRTGKTVRPPNGQETDPKELFLSDFQLAVLEFASISRPGWMARGHVWPTALLKHAGLTFDQFEPSDFPFREITRQLSGVQIRSDREISENYMLGAYLPPEKVPQFHEFLVSNTDRIIAPAEKDGWAYDCRLALKKISEALSDAETRGIGFIEATEVYSAPYGKLN